MKTQPLSHVLSQTARKLVSGALLTGAAAVQPAHAAWVDTWAASVQPIWAADALPLPTGIPDTLEQSTVRQLVRVSIGGRRIRLALSNEYGATPVVVGGAHVAALSNELATIDTSTDRTVTFGGRPATTIAPGKRVVSDPIDMPVPALAPLAVSVYLPQRTPLTTFHWDGRQQAQVVSGNHLSDPKLAGPAPLDARLLLSEVLVDAPNKTDTIVALGDSITDGRGTTMDADRRWTDDLTRSLANNHVPVINAGISGGRLLSDGMGVSGLARLNRDVLARPNIKTVIVLLGTNDIGWPGSSFAPNEAPMKAPMLIAGYRRLIERAHARGVRVVGGTIAPFEGALEGTDVHGYYTPDKDKVRQEVNAWIRQSGVFDAVADFDSVLRDPTHPTRLLPAFDVGDHLHPNDAGNAAMAKALSPAIVFGH
ncbi:SGNH/GDSL hydrolase family protein [Trinickia diaoshuihuensis]|uniref:SGNH/GDSL hydrolase family protein n=1 Tax=Trinickia diaoshuihuensis TaxID=2292265 RepID=UPI000E2478CB|nr:SGNH/GDSL hydrolase family protein [Trinickia diaoshuihuensis]